ncbi:MAG: hypothetical protein AAFU54_02305 [Chloroflexota bacterium]
MRGDRWFFGGGVVVEGAGDRIRAIEGVFVRAVPRQIIYIV